MPFQINTNLDALSAYNALAKVNAQTTKSQLRLATMKRINSVADDTSGFRVGKELEGENLRYQAQLGNIASAKNWLSTAESALIQVLDKLNQVEAKQQDALDPLKNQNSLANDVVVLADEINNILSNTTINGVNVLASANQNFGAGTTLTVNIGAQIGSFASTISALQNTSTNLTASITSLRDNIKNALGYIGNRMQTFESREEFITAARTNNTATISRFFDADMAMEQLNVTKGQIGIQIGTAMLAQLNVAPQSLLSLFR
ncbi:MAG: flagellin [Ignavibacterium sp.]|nr:flagellin [Ignavibacterium sp.]MCX7612419.1 flagellin [Ignavibacterium sp.]MDW8375213.1 flagellin [Ignavibacteriales bacterium]